MRNLGFPPFSGMLVGSHPWVESLGLSPCQQCIFTCGSRSHGCTYWDVFVWSLLVKALCVTTGNVRICSSLSNASNIGTTATVFYSQSAYTVDVFCGEVQCLDDF